VEGIGKAATAFGLVLGLAGVAVHNQPAIGLGVLLIFGGIFLLIDFRGM